MQTAFSVKKPFFALDLTSGVGAVVLDDKNQVLVVQERFTITTKYTWKLPGGMVDPG